MSDNSEIIQVIQTLILYLQTVESNVSFCNEILMCAANLMLYYFSMIDNFYFYHQ